MKRRYRKKNNVNSIIKILFAVTFLFIGLAYASSNKELDIMGTGRISDSYIEKNLILSKSALELKVGNSEKLVATVENGIGGENILWTSSNSGVASVDSSGNVTALSTGKTNITAYCEGMSATCLVKVLNTEGAISFIVDSAEFGDINYNANKIYNFSARIVNNLGVNFKTWSFDIVIPGLNDMSIYYRTQNFDVTKQNCSISGENLLSEISFSGNMEIPSGYNIQDYYPFEIVNIQYTLDNGTVISGDPVNDEPGDVLATGISITPTEAELYVGENLVMNSTITPANATNAVTWSSSDSRIAKINSSGIITAISPGTVTITAEIDSNIAIATINVVKAPTIQSIVLSDSEVDLYEGKTKQLTATLNPENAVGTIKWTSSDLNIATVDGNGKITAIGEGSAIITAKIGNISAQCIVNVSKVVLANDFGIEFSIDSSWGTGVGYGGVVIENNSDTDYGAWTLVSSFPSNLKTILGWVYVSASESHTLDITVEGNVFKGNTFPAHSKIYINGTYEVFDSYRLQDFVGNLQIESFTLNN